MTVLQIDTPAATKWQARSWYAGYPYTDNAAARALLDTAPISPGDREKLAHATVETLLGL